MSISSQGKIVRRISLDALLCVFAMMLSYLEVLLPLSVIIPLPGFRLGLANLAVTVVFVLLSPTDAALVSAVRIVLMGLLFGTPTTLWFSAMGGAFSFLLLLLMRRIGKRCSFLGLSVLSAAAHNAGQIVAAMTVFGASLIASYLPFLLFASVIFGGIVGLLLNVLVPRLSPHFERLRGGART